MKEEDVLWLSDVLERSNWLFYGEFEVYLQDFLEGIFTKELKHWGFSENSESNDFYTAYWSVLSEMVRLNLAEYGTSPRGSWLTPDGERFKSLILGHKDALQQSQEFIYKKYNS